MSTDAIDRGILAALAADGRVPNRKIAERLGVSEGTVRNRLAKLTAGGHLKVAGLVDPNRCSDCQLVFLGAKVAVSSDLRKAAQTISTLPHVKAVTVVSGRYDLIVEVFLPHHELMSFISDHLAATGLVVSTESFVAIECAGKWV